MARWSRRHWLWLLALVPAGALVVLVDAWVQEWVETGRADETGPSTAPRCIP